MKNAWGTTVVGQFFCDWAHRCCYKAQPFLLPYLYQGRLCTDSCSPRNLATLPGQQAFSTRPTSEVGDAMLEMLDCEGNAMSPAEVERQRDTKMRSPLVVRDWEYRFSEVIIVDETGAVDPNIGIMAKVCSLSEVLRLGGSHELLYSLWAQFTLSAVRVNVDVTWSRAEVLLSTSICAVLST